MKILPNLAEFYRQQERRRVRDKDRSDADTETTYEALQRHEREKTYTGKPFSRNRRKDTWKPLVVGYRIGDSNWRLEEPEFTRRKNGKRNKFVRVRCLGCMRLFERRLSHIVQGASRSCRSCGLKGNQNARKRRVTQAD